MCASMAAIVSATAGVGSAATAGGGDATACTSNGYSCTENGYANGPPCYMAVLTCRCSGAGPFGMDPTYMPRVSECARLSACCVTPWSCLVLKGKSVARAPTNGPLRLHTPKTARLSRSEQRFPAKASLGPYKGREREQASPSVLRSAACPPCRMRRSEQPHVPDTRARHTCPTHARV